MNEGYQWIFIEDYEELMRHRHRSEVRHVLKLRTEDRNKALEYLKLVKEKRKEKAKKLEDDCKEQWSLGNRGEKGDWRG